MKKDTIKTCISLESANADILNDWASVTGLSKSEIINHLISSANENGASITVTYNLGKTNNREE